LLTAAKPSFDVYTQYSSLLCIGNTLFKPQHNLKLLFSSLVLANFLLAPDAHAAMKKWVDEFGQVHYGEHVPFQYLRGEHSEINEQGITVKHSKKMKSESELNAEALQRRIKIIADKKKQLEDRRAALRDRVLLDTFTVENDLIIARDARLDSVDSQISLAQTLIKNDVKKLDDVKKRIKKIEKSGRKAPENLYKEVSSVSKQLENNRSFTADKKKERTYIVESFDADVIRFRALMAAKRAAKLKHQEEQLKGLPE